MSTTRTGLHSLLSSLKLDQKVDDCICENRWFTIDELQLSFTTLLLGSFTTKDLFAMDTKNGKIWAQEKAYGPTLRHFWSSITSMAMSFWTILWLEMKPGSVTIHQRPNNNPLNHNIPYRLQNHENPSTLYQPDKSWLHSSGIGKATFWLTFSYKEWQ